jgi:uncharacterized membrane protein YfcA
LPSGGRRREAATPWHRRIRRDLLAWGALAGVCAGLVLGLTGGGWTRAIVLAALVLGACGVLTLLSAMPTKRPSGGRHGGNA